MTHWRDNPKLKGKFHPEYPDDIQVLIHDGGPLFSKHHPEQVWVRVLGCQREIFRGTVLNQPYHLETVSEGSLVKFLMPEGGSHPLMVTDKYLSERKNWIIHPCRKCGFSELYDAPSDLIRVTFPNRVKRGVMTSFTTRCCACGDGQVVEKKSSYRRWKKKVLIEEGSTPNEDTKKK